MAFADLILTDELDLCDGLTVHLKEPTLADSRAIAKLDRQNDELGYGIIAAACVIDRFEGEHAPGADEWPVLDTAEDIVRRAETLQALPSRYANKVVRRVSKLLGVDPEDQD